MYDQGVKEELIIKAKIQKDFTLSIWTQYLQIYEIYI